MQRRSQAAKAVNHLAETASKPAEILNFQSVVHAPTHEDGADFEAFMNRYGIRPAGYFE